MRRLIPMYDESSGRVEKSVRRREWLQSLNNVELVSTLLTLQEMVRAHAEGSSDGLADTAEEASMALTILLARVCPDELVRHLDQEGYLSDDSGEYEVE
jgi:hypothetical protein